MTSEVVDDRDPILSIVLPCLNEAQAIRQCVEDALSTFHQIGIAGEIIVVDNGSVDGSAELARLAGATVVPEPQTGYGLACRRGFETARGEVIAFLDGDGSYAPSDLSRLVLPIIQGGWELVVGSRLGGDISPGAMPRMHRYVGTPLLTLLLNKRLGSGWTDSQTGFMAMSRTTYTRMALASTGHELTSEMLLEAHRLSLRALEVPISYRPRQGLSKLRPIRDGLRHLSLITNSRPTPVATVARPIQPMRLRGEGAMALE